MYVLQAALQVQNETLKNNLKSSENKRSQNTETTNVMNIFVIWLKREHLQKRLISVF